MIGEESMQQKHTNEKQYPRIAKRKTQTNRKKRNGRNQKKQECKSTNQCEKREEGREFCAVASGTEIRSLMELDLKIK